MQEAIDARVRTIVAQSQKSPALHGIKLTPLSRMITKDAVGYATLNVEIDRAARIATVNVRGPDTPPPANIDALIALGARYWPLNAARDLDDAILHLRFNELDIGAIIFKTNGDPALLAAHDAFLEQNDTHWLPREILLLWKRVLKRIDLTSRTLVAIIEPGSCFAGTLAELAFAADRSYILIGQIAGDNKPPATLTLSQVNFGRYPMCNGLTRLETRFLGEPNSVTRAKRAIGQNLDAERAEELGLVTFAFDDVDWTDEIRVFLEERSSFSPDSLTGLEANLRFPGPETMETKIFARLTAWQNWIFQRPNAVGPDGALKRYGSGQKPNYDMTRV